MKRIIVTGGAGFVGSNLIKGLLDQFKKIEIISLDNYSSGSVKNHIISKKVKYLRGDICNFQKIFKKSKKIEAVFHFGEFSRIAQSFKQKDICFKTNLLGSYEVIKFCLDKKIRFIYSATSATLGSNDMPNLSPYAFTKYNNLNLIINLNEWFGLKYEIIYFYNVYGSNQIKKGFMSTVVGVFEEQLKTKKKLTVVKPGNQKRNFTHIKDTVNCVIKAYKLKQNKHYAVYNDKSLSILQLAQLFSKNIKFVKERPGERYQSKLVKNYRGNKIIKYKSRFDIKNYIKIYKKSLGM